MLEPKLSYKEKLTSSSLNEIMDDPWPLDTDPEYEEEDITVVDNGYGGNIELSESFKRRLDKPWERAVIVKLLGREIGYRTLLSRIQTMWRPKRAFRVIDLENIFYIVRFREQGDYLHALLGGPWSIFEHALCVQPWKQEFRTASGRLDSAVVWVRFPGLPVNRYHPRLLRTLGNLVGDTVKIDLHSEKAIRAKYAKVAVTIDLTKPLKGVVYLEGEALRVTYEGIPQICFSCGRHGHAAFGCPYNKEANTVEKGAEDTTHELANSIPKKGEASTSSGNNPYSGPCTVGEWMVVPKRARRQYKKPPGYGIPPTATPVRPPQSHEATQLGNKFQSLFLDQEQELISTTNPTAQLVAPTTQVSSPQAQSKPTHITQAYKTQSTNRKSGSSKTGPLQPKPSSKCNPLKDISNSPNSYPASTSKSTPITLGEFYIKKTPSKPKVPKKSTIVSNDQPTHSVIFFDLTSHKNVIPIQDPHITSNPAPSLSNQDSTSLMSVIDNSTPQLSPPEPTKPPDPNNFSYTVFPNTGRTACVAGRVPPVVVETMTPCVGNEATADKQMEVDGEAVSQAVDPVDQ
ncbi:hypothetical protein Tsubulata_018969 [Turnera subulata]|uniref:CCHC-type domain-containing protein n=1 Tax=Turnera subulata TaxID=218843 RepID=A0A9Q0J936_9ROSI|nr:hypothetical protein Tsubulata_018969 [Turnera subulata]